MCSHHFFCQTNSFICINSFHASFLVPAINVKYAAEEERVIAVSLVVTFELSFALLFLFS
jgi:hypothetical protein